MDYNKNIFDKNKKLYNLLCHYFRKIINDIEYELKIVIKNKDEINNYLSQNDYVYIIYLLNLINKLEYEDYQYIKLSYEELLQ